MKKIILLLFILSCSNIKTLTSPKNKFVKWGYQLQGYEHPYDLVRIYSTEKSLWVIDYASSKGAFTRDQIETLKKKNNTIISYLSIGEAEDYRYYWKSMPKKLLAYENRDWKGNHKVFYWHKTWQNIFLGKNGYVERIMNAGFDGLYLDIVDAFQFLKVKGRDINERAELMADFIIKISNHAKTFNPNAKIIIQNGYTIVNYLKKPESFLQAIDGVAAEGVLYQAYRKPSEVYREMAKVFPLYQKHGAFILSVEYQKAIKGRKKNYLEISKRLNMLPLIAKRKLAGSLEFAKED